MKLEAIMQKTVFLLACLLVASIPSLFAREETLKPQEENAEAKATAQSPPVQHFASGVKKVAYDAPKDLVKETVEEIPKKPPIVSVVEGVNRGIEKSLDHAVKGAYRVATLGTSELESYQVEEPQKGSDEVTKIKISLPGT